MIGHKYSGDGVAAEFLRLRKQLTKEASAEEAPEVEKKAEDLPDPAGFLANQAETHATAGEALDNNIDSLGQMSAAMDAENPAEDKEDDKENEVEIKADKVEIETEDVDVEEADEDDKEDDAKDDMMADMMMSEAGQYVLSGLGKIAGSLRNKNDHFAADIVEVTARSIMKDLVKEASEKASKVDSLEKIASEYEASGNQYSADILKAAITKIQSGK